MRQKSTMKKTHLVESISLTYYSSNILLQHYVLSFSLPQPMMTNSDLGRLLKAFEIQSVIRAPMYVVIDRRFVTTSSFSFSLRSKRQPRRKIKKNPLKNIGLMSRLNPFAPVQKRKTLLQQLKGRRTGTTAATKVGSTAQSDSRCHLLPGCGS